MKVRRRDPGAAAARVLLLLWAAALPARAADTAHLQIAVAAPDPAFAGDTVSFQVLAVNSGTEDWDEGTYFWEAEVYDLGRKYLAKTERVMPETAVLRGGMATAVVTYRLPETFVGRYYFRVFLVRAGGRLVESDYLPFQVVEKPFLAPPIPKEIVEIEKPPEYRVGGNVSLLFRNVGGSNEGATTVNLVGKAGWSSFLFNSYFLHNQEPDRKIIDPYILLFNYYAPWGTAALGDISPVFSPLSLYGQGMRGASLERRKEGPWALSWTLAGGRTVTSQRGSTTTDGRFERWVYGARGTVKGPAGLTLGGHYALGQDNAGSLSASETASKYRGPTLRPQENHLYGLTAEWEPLAGFKLHGDFETSAVSTDTESGVAPRTDEAWRAGLDVSRKAWSLKGWAQRTGTLYTAFGAPTAIPDRMTYDSAFTVSPARWTTAYVQFNQFTDNLGKDPAKTTTTQRTFTAGDSLSLPTNTTVNGSYTLSAVQGKPRTVQDNSTRTLLLGVSQQFRGQTAALSVQNSVFTDKTKTAHDLDSLTLGLRATLRPGDRFTCSLGVTDSSTDDKTDGSSRVTRTLSASVDYAVVRDRLNTQLTATSSSTDSDSTTSPAATRGLILNLETTWVARPDLTFGVGAGTVRTTDSKNPSLEDAETTVSTRVSYSF